MTDKNIKKIIAAGLSASALAGTAFIASDYSQGAVFRPFNSDRKFLANKVYFPDDDTAGYSGDQSTDDNKSFWEENKDSENTEKPNSGNNSGYMYENSSMMLPDDAAAAFSGLSALGEMNTDSNNSGGMQSGRVYDITGDRSSADMIISGGAGGSESSSGSSGSGGGSGNSSIISGAAGISGSGGGGGGGGASGGAGGSADTPDTPGGNSGASDSGNSGSGSITPDRVSDPVPSKPNTTTGGSGSSSATIGDIFASGSFSPSNPENPDNSVWIAQSTDSSLPVLYAMQSYDGYAIFTTLDARVMLDKTIIDIHGNKKDFVDFSDADYNKFIRIKSVSFDGGHSWTESFPVTIPTGLSEGDMYIKVEYRLNASSDWTERLVPYKTSEGRVFVLSRKLTQNYTAIQSDDIVNKYNQYPEVGTALNLYQAQLSFLTGGGVKLDKLFRGWTENGKYVDWLYEMTPGRHILEPGEILPLPDNYTAELDFFWMMPDGQIDSMGSELCYLQTITGYTPVSVQNPISLMSSLSSELTAPDEDVFRIPEYVQAVNISALTPVVTDYIDIPKTVLYIDTYSGSLKVRKGYRVSPDNPNYTSENGILYNKNKTQILGIPEDTRSVTIPSTVDRISVPDGHELDEIVIEQPRTDPEFPKIFGNIESCRFVMSANSFENFLYEHAEDLFNGKNNCLADPYEPSVIYTLDHSALIRDDGSGDLSLYRVLDLGAESIKLPDGLNTVTSYVFAGADSTKKIILPSDGETVDFEQSALRFSSIDTIMCSSQKQLEHVKELLNKGEYETYTDEDGNEETVWNPWLGLSSDDVSLILTENTSETNDGYTYTVDSTDEDGRKHVTIVSAPANIKTFDGVINDTDGNELIINAVGDNAFESCKELEWVTLPESVSSIGYRSFAGCTSLQGVLIERREDIRIGNASFNDCDSLRFVASNALKATMDKDYDPFITDDYYSIFSSPTYFFVLPGAEGYGSYANDLSGLGGVKAAVEYSLVPISDAEKDSVDSRMLYFSFLNADDEEKHVAMRSGSIVPENTVLRPDTIALYSYAMAGTSAPGGDGYTLNWEDLTSLEVLNMGAFMNSMLSGDISVTGRMIYDSSPDEEIQPDDNADSGSENTEPKANGMSKSMLYLADYAFRGCNASSLDFNAQISYIGEQVFVNCPELERVSFEEFTDNTVLFSGSFTACPKLSEIDFNYNYPQLNIYGSAPYTFDSDRTDNGRSSLHIGIPYAPGDDGFEGAALQLIADWMYRFVGSSGAYSGSPYLDLRNNLEFPFLYEFGHLPSDKELSDYVAAKLLEAENTIRDMLGMEEATHTTNLYHWKEVDNYYIYLIGAPKEVYYADTWGSSVGLPSGWSVDYISSGAFEECENLVSVDIASGIVGIESGAFNAKGLYNDMLTLFFYSDTPPELMPEAEGIPFDFGVPDDKLSVSLLGLGSDVKKAYFDSWKYPLAGYSDATAMYFACAGQLSDDELLSYNVTRTIVSAMADKLIETGAVEKLNRFLDYSADTDKASIMQLICDDMGIVLEDPTATPTEYPEIDPDIPDATPSEYPENGNIGEDTDDLPNPDKGNSSDNFGDDLEGIEDPDENGGNPAGSGKSDENESSDSKSDESGGTSGNTADNNKNDPDKGISSAGSGSAGDDGEDSGLNGSGEELFPSGAQGSDKGNSGSDSSDGDDASSDASDSLDGVVKNDGDDAAGNPDSYADLKAGSDSGAAGSAGDMSAGGSGSAQAQSLDRIESPGSGLFFREDELSYLELEEKDTAETFAAKGLGSVIELIDDVSETDPEEIPEYSEYSSKGQHSAKAHSLSERTEGKTGIISELAEALKTAITGINRKETL